MGEQVEEGCRRDDRLQQQNELLTQLIGCLNEARNEPPPLPQEQPRSAQAEPVQNAVENTTVRASNDQNEALLEAPMVGEPVYERFRR